MSSSNDTLAVVIACETDMKARDSDRSLAWREAVKGNYEKTHCSNRLVNKRTVRNAQTRIVREEIAHSQVPLVQDMVYNLATMASVLRITSLQRRKYISEIVMFV